MFSRRVTSHRSLGLGDIAYSGALHHVMYELVALLESQRSSAEYRLPHSSIYKYMIIQWILLMFSGSAMQKTARTHASMHACTHLFTQSSTCVHPPPHTHICSHDPSLHTRVIYLSKWIYWISKSGRVPGSKLMLVEAFVWTYLSPVQINTYSQEPVRGFWHVQNPPTGSCRWTLNCGVLGRLGRALPDTVWLPQRLSQAHMGVGRLWGRAHADPRLSCNNAVRMSSWLIIVISMALLDFASKLAEGLKPQTRCPSKMKVK